MEKVNIGKDEEENVLNNLLIVDDQVSNFVSFLEEINSGDESLVSRKYTAMKDKDGYLPYTIEESILTPDGDRFVTSFLYEHYGFGFVTVTCINTAAGDKKVISMYDSSTKTVLGQKLCNGLGFTELNTSGEFYTEERGEITSSFRLQDANEKQASYAIWASSQIRRAMVGYDVLLRKTDELGNGKVLSK